MKLGPVSIADERAKFVTQIDEAVWREITQDDVFRVSELVNRCEPIWLLRFVRNSRYLRRLRESLAGAFIIEVSFWHTSSRSHRRPMYRKKTGRLSSQVDADPATRATNMVSFHA